MAATIKDIAKYCGLSVSTVSKALNGYSDISEETRKTVQAAVQFLDYHPNSHARALKKGRSYNLGVLFSDDSQSGLTHPYFSHVLESFKKTAENAGYDITFISHRLGQDRFTFLDHCRYREVDGVCIACIQFDDDEVLRLIHSDLPLVTIDNVFDDRVCVCSDNEGGMRSVPRKDNTTMCFTETADGKYRLRPLYYVSDADKAWYKEYYGIKYSDAYEVYGLTRTGCCGCPISYKAVDDLELIRPFEPTLVKAAWNVFGDSYRYRQQYNAYKAERQKAEKERKQKKEIPVNPVLEGQESLFE